jgi:hypothetical protein
VSAKKPSARVKVKPPHSSEAPAAKRKASGRAQFSESKEAAKEASQAMDARSSKDRRGDDRRQSERSEGPVEVERRTGERRAKVNRRRQIDPTTCERDYSAEEVEFMSALDDYKRRSGRMFPTCSEILEVIRGLGYDKQGGESTAAQPPEPAFVAAMATEQAV